MKEIIIFCDTCAGVNKEEELKYNIKIIPTLFYIDNKEYNPINCSLTHEKLYQILEGKSTCKTSCINPNTFIDSFRPYLKEGKSILYISISSGLSGNYQSAKLAKDILEDEYPNSIELIDSLSGSLGIKYTIFEAIKLINEGEELTAIKEKLDKNKLNVNASFTIGSLDHLRRGGRLSGFSAVVGSILRINPIIKASKQGKLEVTSKHRGRLKALSSLIDDIKKEASTSTLYIGYTNNLDEALKLKETILTETEIQDVEMDYIDYTLSCHCGPKTIAVFYKRKS